MVDTGFAVSQAGDAGGATMYTLDANNTLRDDAMGPAPITPPTFCMGGAGLWSTVDDYLTFIRMLLGDGTADGVRVLSEESVRLMRTDRLTHEQKKYPFLGMPFWRGRGFGLNLSVVTDPAQSRQLFGPGGLGTFSWPGAYGTWWQADPSADLIMLYLIQNLPDLSPEPRPPLPRSRATPRWPSCSRPSHDSCGTPTRRSTSKRRSGRRAQCRGLAAHDAVDVAEPLGDPFGHATPLPLIGDVGSDDHHLLRGITVHDPTTSTGWRATTATRHPSARSLRAVRYPASVSPSSTMTTVVVVAVVSRFMASVTFRDLGGRDVELTMRWTRG